MARGANEKLAVQTKILETFPGSFAYEKEIRVPMVDENGETIQIKVTLTAAKTNVEAGGDVAIPGAAKVTPVVSTPEVVTEPIKASAEEQNAVSDLMAQLGL